MNSIQSHHSTETQISENQQDLLDRLCTVLEHEMDHLKESRETLEQLKAMLTQREMALWPSLLMKMRSHGQAYTALEADRLAILYEIAQTMQMEASRLSANILKKRFGLQCPSMISILEKLKRESVAFRKVWAGCRAILWECQNYNRQFLKAIQIHTKQPLTYNAHGGIVNSRISTFLNCSF